MGVPSEWTTATILAAALSGVTSVLTAILGVLGVRLFNKVDKLEADARQAITREELMQHMEIMRTDRARMHEENQTLLGRIFDKLDDHSELREKCRRNEEDIQRLTDRLNQLQREG